MSKPKILKINLSQFHKKSEPVFTVSHKKVKMLVSFIEPKCQFHEKKWKCSYLEWFQNDKWFFMKNLSSMVILKLVEKSLLICHSFTETVKLVTENWSWIVHFFQFFIIPEKSWLKNSSQILDEDDYRCGKKKENYFHFFFETGPVSWNYFTFFSQFHFFSCFFCVKTRVFGLFL